ncbi:hypothetical protein MJO28_005858 [Puccinia striiformis f. sp. tritici]|uniref:Uncharacterized protein n=1 Tax=Puccinia striiformis f. sp. tritici TaxID=168172 RepID=A0ACC0EFD0_9BASI|nr:hypothetical protein MJO28_005858 [Puccinia striiformis f. sp. tritici]
MQISSIFCCLAFLALTYQGVLSPGTPWWHPEVLKKAQQAERDAMAQRAELARKQRADELARATAGRF